MGKTLAFPFVGILERTGAPVFGVAGTHVMRLLREISRAGLGNLYVPARTELCAGYMATGYSRATGGVSFCLLTPGPGFLIGSCAMLEAKVKGTPVVFVSGQVHRDARGLGAKALHEFEGQAASATSIIDAAFFPEGPSEADRLLADAVRASLSPPVKPSYVELPVDVLTHYEPAAPAPDLTPRKPAPPSPDMVKGAENLINRARRPVILAGYGAIFPGCGEKLLRLAETIDAPLFTTITAKGAIPETHRLAGGVYRQATAREVMGKGDILIALGTSFSLISTGNRKGPFPPEIVHVNLDPSPPVLPGTKVHHLQCTAEDFLAAVDPHGNEGGSELPGILAKARREHLRLAHASYPSETAYVATMEEKIPGDAHVFTDPTIISYWMRYLFGSKAPGLYHYPSGSNSLGFALPAAIGALTASRVERAYVITGDGNFPYFAAELQTAAEYPLDITVILFNDSGYGVLREWEKWGGLEKIGVNLKNPDFGNICAASGIDYNRADSPEELGVVLESTKKRRGTALIEVRQDLLPPWKVL